MDLRSLQSRYLFTFALPTAALVTLLFNPACASAGTSLPVFSANLTRVVNKVTSSGRIFTTLKAIRTETKAGKTGQDTIVIVRLDLNQTDTLMSAGKVNIEVPYGGEAGGTVAEFAQYLDGATVQRKSLGVAQTGPYDCEKFLVQVSYEGRVYTSIDWAARELHGFVVRREGEQGEWSSQYSNIRLGPQDSALFEIPIDYATISYSRDWTEVTQQMYWANDSSPAGLASRGRAAGLKVTGDDGSQPSTDYSLNFIDPITGSEVFIMSVIIDPALAPRPESPPDPVTTPQPEFPRDPITSKLVAVQRSDAGNQYLLDVSFVVPPASKMTFDTIIVYGMQILDGQRSHDQNYPTVQGHWQSGDRAEFTVLIPKEVADPAKGWNITFCIGSTTGGCYPSPNLLTLIAPSTR
jgi:hypothetical protein